MSGKPLKSTKMNPIYLETRFKRDLNNDPNFDMFEILPDEFAIITAYATTGEQWSDIFNEQEDERLQANLLSRFSCVKRITGYSPSTGHSEPGWLVNCSFGEGCDIGLLFKQDAIYWGENGNLFVSYCGPQRSKVWVLETTFCFGVKEWGGR
jgi:hypothetical protein